MKSTTKESTKGMWRRTILMFTKFRVPWHLYLFDALLGILSTRVALLYIPYQSEMELGNLTDWSIPLGYLGFSLLSVVVSLIAAVPGFYASAQVNRNLQNKLIRHSLSLPVLSFEKNASQIVSWITVDCSYADGLIGALVGFITGIATMYMSLQSMAAIDLSLAYLVPFILVYVIFSTWFEGKLMFLRERRGRRADAELTAYLSEHLGFFTQIKQLHAKDEEQTRARGAIQNFYRADIYQSSLTLLNNMVNGSLSTIITILIFVLGVPRVTAGTITMTELVSFQNYILIAYQSFSSIPSLYTNFMYSNGQLFYIARLMFEPEEKTKRQHGLDNGDADLVFEHVSFGYDAGEDLALKDISLTIPKGKTTVIAGPNGSGKTTLFKLIERFYTPQTGTIRFGDSPLEDIHLDEWRKNIAYVLQDSPLINASIRDNIAYGLDHPATDEEIESAAKLACADGFIHEIPEGYDFVVGENGAYLSGGQRQRVAIARAMLLNPSYLLLDEATCNIDVYAEEAITNALLTLMRGRTVVMITHDMRHLERADHVVVLNDGTVEASGTFENTKNTSPTLQSLLKADRGSQEGADA